jgi:hypothetical protein
MIEISIISRELTDTHPGFVAGCAQRGHAISVFDQAPVDAGSRETPGGTARPGSNDPDAPSASTGPASVDIGPQS